MTFQIHRRHRSHSNNLFDLLPSDKLHCKDLEFTWHCRLWGEKEDFKNINRKLSNSGNVACLRMGRVIRVFDVVRRKRLPVAPDIIRFFSVPLKLF